MRKLHRWSLWGSLWDVFNDVLGMTRALGVLRASTGEVVQSVLPPMMIMDYDYAVTQMVKRFLNQPNTHEFLEGQQWDQFNFEVYEVPFYIRDRYSAGWEERLVNKKPANLIIQMKCDIIAVLARQIATHDSNDLPRASALSENLRYIRKYISKTMMEGKSLSVLRKDFSNFTNELNWGLVTHAYEWCDSRDANLPANSELCRYKAMYRLSLSGKLDNEDMYACTENYMKQLEAILSDKTLDGFTQKEVNMLLCGKVIIRSLPFNYERLFSVHGPEIKFNIIDMQGATTCMQKSLG